MFTQPPCKKLLIIACGSIHVASLQTYLFNLRPEFTSEIDVILTRSALRFVVPEVLALYLDRRPHTDDEFDGTQGGPHIRLTESSDMVLVLPATANILGKAAHGIADDLASTAILAAERVIFAPAMNPHMWVTPAVQRNVAQLREDGHVVVDPTPGVSMTTGRRDTGLGPTLESVLAFLWQQRMQQLKREGLPSVAGERKLLPLTVAN